MLSLRAFQEMIAFLKTKEEELLSLKVIYKKDMKRRSTFMAVLSTHCAKVQKYEHGKISPQFFDMWC